MKFYIIILSVLYFTFFIFPQGKELREDVTVTNVELPVRVIFKKSPISGLTKDDFMLFVNGKEKKISGFYEEKKKISIGEAEYQANQRTFDPRLFVLVFNITSFHLDVNKGIDYFFNHVIKVGDKLMVLINDKFLPEIVVEDLKSEKEKLKKISREQSKKANVHMAKIVLDLESSLRRLKYLLADKSHPAGLSKIQLIERYLIKYLEYFRLYKQSYLIPDMNKYYNFAKYLDQRKEKKWVINFYQFEKYPKLKQKSRFRRQVEQFVAEGEASFGQQADVLIPARQIQKLLFAIEKETEIADDFPVKEIKQLFLQVNTTFHTLFMKSIEILDSEDYELKKISTDIESSLREITKVTGGELLLSNNLELSLKTISEVEDIFYVLSYAPEENEKSASIRIELPGKSYKIIYNRNVYEDFFSNFLKRKKSLEKEIKLKDLDFSNRKLTFFISGFKSQKVKNKDVGKIEIAIKIINSDKKKVFNQKKGIAIKEMKTKISIKFNKLKPGNYSVIVNVRDLLNNSSVEDYMKFTVK
ncbi:MAG: hypothetical protein ABFR75_11560 [Acidobacteriota bacterium]